MHLVLAQDASLLEVCLLNFSPIMNPAQKAKPDASNRIVYAFAMRNPFFDFKIGKWHVLVPDIGAK